MAPSLGLRTFALFVFLTALVTVCAATALKAERVALVIGNSEYNTNPLVNPINDAIDMAARLSEIGFRVHGDGPQLQQSLREMQVSIRDFTRSLNPGDMAVFYFAGHGVEYKGTNYLIPVDDEEIAFAEDIPDWSYPAPRLLERLAATGATGIIILDACRNNPLPERGRDRDMGTGLTAMETPAGASAFIMYAAAPGQTSSDGDGRNGLFTEALLEALERPTRRVDDIMYQVSFAVRNATDGRQVPWLEFAFAGEIPPHFQNGDGREDSNEVPVQVAAAPQSSGGKPGRGIVEDGRALYGVVDLTGAMPEAGLTVDLLAGGYEDATQLGGACVGFVASNPDLMLTVDIGANPLGVAAVSDEPTVLILRTASGVWHCVTGSADAPPQMEIPLEEDGPQRLWVGTVVETARAPDATLVFAARDGADAEGDGIINLGDLPNPEPAGESDSANPDTSLERSLIANEAPDDEDEN